MVGKEAYWKNPDKYRRYMKDYYWSNPDYRKRKMELMRQYNFGQTILFGYKDFSILLIKELSGDLK